jgi:hypothetical protein
MPTRRTQHVVYRAISRRYSSTQARQAYNAFISYKDGLNQEERQLWHQRELFQPLHDANRANYDITNE